jgi:1-deoxy-D-xylulose-5-phosphate reductoisomerase
VVCERHKADLTANPSLSDVLAVDAWARQAVREAAARLHATVHSQAPAALPA